MELVEILRDAMDRIADPARWTQGALARDAAGRQLSHLHEGYYREATTWCSTGSVERSIDFTFAQDVWLSKGRYSLHDSSIELLQNVAHNMNFKSITDLNDNGTHEDVMLMFKRAIALAESVSTS